MSLWNIEMGILQVEIELHCQGGEFSFLPSWTHTFLFLVLVLNFLLCLSSSENWKKDVQWVSAFGISFKPLPYIRFHSASHSWVYMAPVVFLIVWDFCMNDLHYLLSDLITDSVCLHVAFSFCLHSVSCRNVAESLSPSEGKYFIWLKLY